jgi:centromere/kinetochore protein ZW10
LSKEIAPDVDGWIAQAKKLQADIERSKATARNIVAQAEAGKALKEKTHDAGNKVQLLEKEVAFNQSLATTLELIRSSCRILDQADQAFTNNDFRAALDHTKQCDDSIAALSAVQDTRAVGLLQTRCSRFKANFLDKTTDLAQYLLQCDITNHTVTIKENAAGLPAVDLTLVIEILEHLGGLDIYIRRLKRDIEFTLFNPRLSTKPGQHNMFQVKDGSISVSSTASKPDTIATLDDMWVALDFFSTHLPKSVCEPLSQKLLPSLFEILTFSWLDQTVPVQIEQMPVFQQILDRVSKLAEQIDALHWSSTALLKDWVQSAPRTWLSKRRETALGAARSLLFSGLKDRKTVERVETQTVSKGDAIMGGTDVDEADDAWAADWEEDTPATKEVDTKMLTITTNDDDDDASAWDMDVDDTDVQAKPPAPAPAASGEDEEEDAADAWGWGDDEQATDSTSKPESPEKTKKPQKTDQTTSSGERELTLRETYTVTAVPDGMLEIVMQVVSDAETLTDPSYSGSPIGPAASALYTLPTFVLAIYRATASTAYGKLDSGNMLIYNDASRLADQIRSFVNRQAEKDANSTLPTHLRPSSRLRLDNDIKALETFAKRAYSAEMESQRTIIRDMLDGAQGFSNCNAEPFASACESAVSITEERLRDVHKQWASILSRSALLQSSASLLSTALGKMIMEIEEIQDIGEEESKKLRQLCDEMSKVKDLFMQEHAEGGETSDMTGIYCPNWFKFQYLGELLESSLADIKYLWTEGELRLEFEADEVTDLIEALFADSDYRRKAIADIRRS